jgi:carbamate kinase
VATLIAQVVVDEHDPAFQYPTKPVGPFYSADEARRRSQELGWQMVEDSARGYRRVVPSPEPLELVEIDGIRSLVQDGFLVIAVGGGIPVVWRDGHLTGVEAVIDKDRASALLATLLDVDIFMISTATEHVYLNYMHPDQRPIERMTMSDAQAYLDAGHFPPSAVLAAGAEFRLLGSQETMLRAKVPVVAVVAVRTGCGKSQTARKICFSRDPCDQPIG